MRADRKYCGWACYRAGRYRDAHELRETVRRMWEAGHTAAEIAHATGRPKGTIGGHVQALQIAGQLRRRVPHQRWIRDEDDALIRLRGFGLRHGEIAVALDRTEDSVRCRASELISYGLLTDARVSE
jgi:predicted transcriptional regulator